MSQTKQIDLDEIINNINWFPTKEINSTQRILIKEAMLEFGRQLLERASERAKVRGLKYIGYEIVSKVDKQSITDTIKLVKP